MALKRRIKRDYRRLPPARFLAFCRKVKYALTDNLNYPDSTWGGHTMLRQIYFEKVDTLETAYHVARDGDRRLIRDRDKLVDEIVDLLDQIAPLLEAASIRNPDALFSTGFSITQERRSTNRTKLVLTAPGDFSVVNSGEPGKAVGRANAPRGAINHEIHLNTKDPSLEEEWFHKAIYPDASAMVMDNLQPGNTYFRMRHHGPEGPGPWSVVMSVAIS
jgi:hypothetical protein